MIRVSVFGEPLLELSTAQGGCFGPARLSFAGDTLNTAVYLARLGIQVEYITALGTDPWSDALVEAIKDEGIGTRNILRHPSRMPGLYAIQTDEVGERSFTYWRDQSAARAFFDLPGAHDCLQTVMDTQLFYFSGISLSILDVHGRTGLTNLAKGAQAKGVPVAFDGNYRPRGWSSLQQARAAMRDIAPAVAIVLPTHEDDDALFGPNTPAAHALRWRAAGADLVVVKRGPNGAVIFDGTGPGRCVPVLEPVQPRDTTGAGDSFNAGFLAAYLKGCPPADAAVQGHKLAGTVIQYPGAIIPASAMPTIVGGPMNVDRDSFT